MAFFIDETPRLSSYSTSFLPPKHDVTGSLTRSLAYTRLPHVGELKKADDVRRPYIKQLLEPKLRFPLLHRVAKSTSTFVSRRPSTFPYGTYIQFFTSSDSMPIRYAT
ncbi:hypothetical protein EV401DRAFT_1306603 [Pisolithus croceorrhizus]|nr:hypothetical protein EV401DRAFT_1306603 [Pisolithus croceorrhizus]